MVLLGILSTVVLPEILVACKERRLEPSYFGNSQGTSERFLDYGRCLRDFWGKPSGTRFGLGPKHVSVRPIINTDLTAVTYQDSNSLVLKDHWEIGALLLRPQQVIIGGTLDNSIVMWTIFYENCDAKRVTGSAEGLVTKDHLDDFEECKGGSVTFGGSKSYITGKGYCHLIRANQRDSVFVNFGAMLHNISRDDLVDLYKIVLQKTTAYGPEEDLERAFAENLRLCLIPPQ
ncbi:hypothetical protein Tco_0058229 [Tanacetum coccineum]